MAKGLRISQFSFSIPPPPPPKKSLKLCPIGCEYYNLTTWNNIQNNTNTINLYPIAKLYNKQILLNQNVPVCYPIRRTKFSPLPFFFHFMLNECFTIHILFVNQRRCTCIEPNAYNELKLYHVSWPLIDRWLNEALWWIITAQLSINFLVGAIPPKDVKKVLIKLKSTTYFRLYTKYRYIIFIFQQ